MFCVFVTGAGPHHEDDRWVADESDGCGELPLVAAAVGSAQLVSVVGEAELLEGPLHNLTQGTQKNGLFNR